MLSKEELVRYNRQIILPNFGLEGQEKLKASKVLIIGAGGLGIPNISYLAAAGVGEIGIVEFDEVSLTNLQRQVIYSSEDIGKSKVSLAEARINQLNPNVKVRVFETTISASNAMQIIGEFDLVVDGSDNLPTRYLVNDTCVLLNKPLVYAAIFRYEGQVSVFNQLQVDGNRGPNYRDLFPTPPPPHMVPSCNEGGVFGALAGIIGAMQANEAIKVLAGIGETLSGRLLIYDSLDFTTRFLNIKRNPNNPISGENPSITQLIDYESFCGMKEPRIDSQSITVHELNQILSSENAPFLLDVRESYEYEIANLGGHNIPLAELKNRLSELPKLQAIVVHCKSGARSKKAIQLLREARFTNLKNLEGGILAWQKEIDPTLDIY
ncbi:MAG: molybdopterin/thiamine biosynthesis adenylyltransferase/rhodanese-related sulfurtransferase [Roseivirga sp.]